jgi:ADP-glucose pyrophosphorylase
MIQEGSPCTPSPFDGYWHDVTTIDSYYAASIILRPLPPIHLNDPDWPLHAERGPRPASSDEARCLSSMIAHGTRIEGTVRR